MPARPPGRPTAGATPRDRPSETALPRGSHAVALVVALCAVSTSGPIIAAMAVPGLAIAFWRTALATAVLLPAALLTRRRELSRLTGRELRWALLAGVLLAAHFATWVPSLFLTSVASATALVATQPVWAALLARAAGRGLPRRAWAGTLVAVAGAGVLAGVDVSLDPRALLGDLLAVTGGAFAAAYVVAGAEVRRSVSTTTYTLLCYGTCSLVLLPVCLLADVPLGGYAGADWVRLLALTLGAQLLGHSLVNVVLSSTSATVVSLSILFEVPGAALLAAVFLGQVPPLAAVPGLALLLVGVAVVVTSRERAAPVVD